MLSDNGRLTKKDDFLKHIRQSRKIDTTLATYYFCHQNLDFTLSYDNNGNFINPTVPKNSKYKLAVIISAKLGKAHDRNKIKRQLKGILRELNPTVRLIIKYKIKVKGLSYNNIKTDFTNSYNEYLSAKYN